MLPVLGVDGKTQGRLMHMTPDRSVLIPRHPLSRHAAALVDGEGAFAGGEGDAAEMTTETITGDESSETPPAKIDGEIELLFLKIFDQALL